MKTAIMSDFHSENPLEEVERLTRSGIEKFIFLGDYDNPQILRDLLNLNVKHKKILTGNHDYDFAQGRQIYSPLLLSGIDYPRLWAQFPEEKQQILSSSKENPENKVHSKVIDTISGKKIVYVHGSLDDGEYPYDSFHSNLHGRVFSDWGGPSLTFEKMIKEDFWILFKGHDHHSRTYSIPLEEKAFSPELRLERGNVKFDKNRRYIVCVGCFNSVKGKYSIFDEDKLSLEVRKRKYSGY